MTTTQNVTATRTDPLWQKLTDALNALLDAGQFAHAPWVVLDLTARRFTVSSRERTLTGDHLQQPRREHA
ncbi:hypothetical protein [Streptomyces flaveolus]|uniref:hypothetical protein n=1 Tax=Streptomyces flaveolus TaxID=67297 RepID=UPI00331E6327